MYSTDQLIAKIQAQAIASGIDPAIAVAQARQESVNFAPRYVYGPGVSPKGAQGLFQFMPATAARFGLVNAFDPDQAIFAWSKYMTFLLGMFAGRYDLALAGYNWGEHRTTLQTALQNGDSVLNYSIPAETRNYVITILGNAGYDPNAGAGSPPVAPTGIIDVGDLGTVDITAPPDDNGGSPTMILAFVGILVGAMVLSSIA